MKKNNLTKQKYSEFSYFESEPNEHSLVGAPGGSTIQTPEDYTSRRKVNNNEEVHILLEGQVPGYMEVNPMQSNQYNFFSQPQIQPSQFSQSSEFSLADYPYPLQGYNQAQPPYPLQPYSSLPQSYNQAPSPHLSQYSPYPLSQHNPSQQPHLGQEDERQWNRAVQQQGPSDSNSNSKTSNLRVTKKGKKENVFHIMTPNDFRKPSECKVPPASEIINKEDISIYTGQQTLFRLVSNTSDCLSNTCARISISNLIHPNSPTN